MATSAPNIEPPLVKTKIIATVGPACCEESQLSELVLAGVDVFRLNFAHGTHEWLAGVLERIRRIEEDLDRPIGVLSDLAGPKIRLGELENGSLLCQEGATVSFVRGTTAAAGELTCTYEQLIDDVSPGDRILMADGTVAVLVEREFAEEGRIECKVVRPGTVRSRQGVNLPGVTLSTPSLTEKDRVDLDFALDQQVDFVGLSFVRQADDIHELREAIAEHPGDHRPQIVAKIEKEEAIADLDAIVDLTDAVMVARGDLGVEIDLARVPILQKQIIRKSNQHRVPVITATEMLDSMITSAIPTRAEASDVANAVLDGSDAVMLSGETAIGENPTAVVRVMSRIVSEAEGAVGETPSQQFEPDPRAIASEMTEAVTIGAVTVAERLGAGMLIVATVSGRTALAVSKERSRVPVVAVSACRSTARRMNLYWGVRSLYVPDADHSPPVLLESVCDWGRRQGVLESGQQVVLVGSSDWSDAGHDLVMVHTVP